jgi:hypothetical protein
MGVWQKVEVFSMPAQPPRLPQARERYIALGTPETPKTHGSRRHESGARLARECTLGAAPVHAAGITE